MNIGSRIKQRREFLGMSQEELAHKVGYKSRSSINKIESDGRGLPQSKIIALANALDTTPSYLMGWTDNSHGSEKYVIFEQNQESFYIPSDGSGSYSEEEKELLQLFSNLNEENREKVILYSKNLHSIQCLNEEQELLLSAAHERTDIKITDEMRKCDEDIMDDENF